MSELGCKKPASARPPIIIPAMPTIDLIPFFDWLKACELQCGCMEHTHVDGQPFSITMSKTETMYLDLMLHHVLDEHDVEMAKLAFPVRNAKDGDDGPYTPAYFGTLEMIAQAVEANRMAGRGIEIRVIALPLGEMLQALFGIKPKPEGDDA